MWVNTLLNALSGEVSWPTNNTIVDNWAVIWKLLTWLTTTSWVILSTDTIIQAFSKLKDSASSNSDHLNLWNIGSNSHATIDVHLANSSIHFTRGIAWHETFTVTSSAIKSYTLANTPLTNNIIVTINWLQQYLTEQYIISWDTITFLNDVVYNPTDIIWIQYYYA